MTDAPHRPTLENAVAVMALPSAAWRDMAINAEGGRETHDRLLADAACMGEIELRQPDIVAEAPTTITVAAWNLERCKHVGPSANVLRASGADVALLTEMDLGMARSGNRHTTADLAADRGMGYAFGVEFVELGLGDLREQADHAGEANAAGLHGNAIASRFAIDRALVLPLDRGGLWYAADGPRDQRRIGGRMAVAVRHLLPRPVWFVAVHYESSLGPADRAVETENLLAQVEAACGDEPVLIAGDFNCRGMCDAGVTGSAVLDYPETIEPMFARFANAGFDWRQCNSPAVTTRLHPYEDPALPLKKIDWFFARGLTCFDPWTHAALGPDGTVLSDHEPISVTVALP
ncbi:MAG: endonuclease/exonuclease/phosphatase family protein [Rhodobiaceae bacterium]|nr:endonuclease/exonuclease/phosphatase family protein [Rhodobiaceae bacterium]